MRKISTFVLAIILASFYITSYSVNIAEATGTTYYVDFIDGDDAKTGTSEANAWKTLAKVNTFLATPDAVVAGDTFRFKRGTGQNFSGVDSGNDHDGALIIPVSGSASLPITFSDYSTGNRPNIRAANNQYGVLFLNSSHIKFENINIIGSEDSAFKLHENSSYIDISSSAIDGSASEGDVTLPYGISATDGSNSFLNVSYLSLANTKGGIFAEGFSSFDDITVDHTSFNNNTESGIYIRNNIQSSTASNMIFDNVVAGANTKLGMGLWNVDLVTVIDSSFSSNIYDGIFVNGGSGVVLSNIEAKYNGHKYTVDGASKCARILQNDPAISDEDKANYIIYPYGAGLYYANVSDMAVYDSTLSNNCESGIQSETRDVTDTFMDIGSTSSTGLILENLTLDSNAYDGIYVSGSGSDMLINNIDASQNKYDGVAFHDNLTAITISDSSFVANGSVNDLASGDGVNFRDNTQGTLSNSRIFNNQKSGVVSNEASQSITTNCILSHATHGTAPMIDISGSGTHRILHNTLIASDKLGIAIEVSDLILQPTADVYNNIVYGFNKALAKHYNTESETYDNVTMIQHKNLFFNNNQDVFGFDLGDSLVSDPLFYNLSGGDFSLTLHSPAIDAAYDIGITVDFNGVDRQDNPCVANTGYGTNNFYDIGAIESIYSGTCPSTSSSDDNDTNETNGTSTTPTAITGTNSTLARTGPTLNSIFDILKF